MEQMQSFISNYGYLAVLVLAFLGAMCIPIPSEITFGFAGALCSTGFVTDKHLQLWAVIVVGVLGTVAGSFVAYLVGRYGGRAFVDRYGKFVLLSHEDLDRAHAWFHRWGDGAVGVGQVIPFVRAFVGFGAGVARVRRTPFLVLTTIGAAVWVTVISVIGYEAGSSWHTVLRWFGSAGYVIAAGVVIMLVFAVVHRWRRYHEAQARHARKR
jgi:membrane protein DedA with SNARE-associated domain